MIKSNIHYSVIANEKRQFKFKDQASGILPHLVMLVKDGCRPLPGSGSLDLGCASFDMLLEINSILH